MIEAFAKPTFDPAGIAAVPTTTYVKIIQSEFMHDTAIITLRNPNLDVPYLQPGTPVMLSYGWANVQLDYFYGYIDHVNSGYHRMVPQSLHYHDVVCLGASYCLKDPWTGSWTGVQASALVRQIATAYNLSSMTQSNDTVWPQISSPGSSAWSFLVNLAQKLGYTLACNKTLVRFTSVDQAMVQNWSSMPLFASGAAANGQTNETLTQFDAVTGEATGLGGNQRAVRQAGGIDLRTGNVITVTDDASSMSTLGRYVPYPFFTQNVNQLVVTDQIQGQASLAGVQQQNRFHYQATAKVSGTPYVTQGMPVVIAGVEGQDNGVWWVQEVCHNFRIAAYTMDLTLGRDSSGMANPTGNPNFGVNYSVTNPYSPSNVPPTTLVGNRWRAAYGANTTVTG